MRFEHIQALTGAVGVSLGRSRSVLIDQARIDGFAEVTEDRQWIHVDPQRAGSGPYGVTIAHGYLTLSLMSVFLEDLFDVANVDSRINYGLGRVRFPAPVAVNSTVSATGEILAVREAPDSTQVDLRMVVESATGDRPVCVADLIVLLRPSRAQASA
ncbi:MaoC family dehydratase [Streptomyces sp. NPDC001982]|uniref:MaoC family dehydratase n=1 Tax=Streptomyces sp. NPDC001982 TaxID=3154405 RepID=UPI00332B08D5